MKTIPNYKLIKETSWEIFVEIKGYKYPYFVSNFGRVRKGNNKFLKVSTIKNSDGLYVSLRNNENEKRPFRLISLAALVLQTFQGGYSKNRKILYKDGNKENCRYNNLEWMYGFNGEIDLTNLGELSSDDKLVVNYMKTKDMKYIYDLVHDNRRLIWLIAKRRRATSYFDDVKIDLFISLKSVFDDGRYKPNKDSIKGLLRLLTNWHLTSVKVIPAEPEMFESDIEAKFNEHELLYGI